MNNLLAQSEDRGLAAGQQVTGTQENAIGRWLGTGGQLLGSEQNRNNLGFQLLLQDLMRQSGIPPELAQLMGGGGGGGGIQFPEQTSTQGTLLSGLGPLLGGLVSGLPGLFGGGGNPTSIPGGNAWGDAARGWFGETGGAPK
jgi:hypothetical protein